MRGLEGGREEGAGESTPPAHRLALFPHPHLSQLLILLLQQPQLLLQGFELRAVVQQLRLGQRCPGEGVMGVRVLPGVSVVVSAPATLLAGTVPVHMGSSTWVRAGAKAGRSPLRGFRGMIMLLLLLFFLFLLLFLHLFLFSLLTFLPLLLLLLLVIIRV